MCTIDVSYFDTEQLVRDHLSGCSNGIVFFDFVGHNQGVVDAHQVRMLCYLISAAAHQVGVTDTVIKTLFEHQYVGPGRATRRYDVVIPTAGLSDVIIKQIVVVINDYNAFGCMSINQYCR